MFVTRNRLGAWHFGDAAAKSLDEWKNAADEKFGRLAVGQTRADLEAAAIPESSRPTSLRSWRRREPSPWATSRPSFLAITTAKSAKRP